MMCIDYIRIITDESTLEKVILKVEYLPKDKEELDFKFSNNLYQLEKRILKVKNEFNKLINPYGIKSMIPKKLSNQEKRISKKCPFVYYIEADIIDKGDKVLLEFKSVEYLLNKSIKYFILLESENAKSNKLSFTF